MARLALLMSDLRAARRRRSGNAIVELALAAPILMALTFGVGDFARLFSFSVVLNNAAGAGAFYATRTFQNTKDTAKIRQVALNEASEISGATASATVYCKCSDGSDISCTSTCTGGVRPRVYVRVTTSGTFRTLVRMPGIPSQLTVTKVAVARAR